MHTGAKLEIAAVVLIVSLGCNEKDPKEVSLDSVPAVQNSSAQNQNMSLIIAQKADSTTSRPSLTAKEDSLGNRPSPSALSVAGSSSAQDTAKDGRSDDRGKRDLVDNLPDLRSGFKKQAMGQVEENEKPETPSTVKKPEEAHISPIERVLKSKEAMSRPNKRGAQLPEDKQLPHGRLPEQRPGSGEQKSIKVQAKDLTEKYEGLKARSRRYYQMALGFLGNQDDSALIYANKAIQTFENGSLFRVKAEALYNLKYFTNAEIACDVCLNRTDHWDFADVDRAVKLKCGCDKKNYERFPSQESKEQYENACKAAAGISGGK
jgi:hypothetical protein